MEIEKQLSKNHTYSLEFNSFLVMNSKVYDLLVEDEAIEQRSLAEKVKNENQVLGLKRISLNGINEIRRSIDRIHEKLKCQRFKKWKNNATLVMQGILINKDKSLANTLTVILNPNLSEIKNEPILDQDFNVFLESLKDIQIGNKPRTARTNVLLSSIKGLLVPTVNVTLVSSLNAEGNHNDFQLIDIVQSITKTFSKCLSLPESKKLCKEILRADDDYDYSESWIQEKEKKLHYLKNELSEKTIDSKYEKASALEKIEEAEVKIHNMKSKTFAKNDSPSKYNVKWQDTQGLRPSTYKNEYSSPNQLKVTGNSDYIDSKISSLVNKYKEGEIDSLEEELIGLKRNIVSQIQGNSTNDFIRTEDYDFSTVRNKNSGNLGKSMRKLQETLSQKERADNDKINFLSIRNEDMKDTIRELLKKLEELENINSRNHQKGAEDQIEISSLSKEVLLLKERISELKCQEEKFLNTESELQQEIIHLKSKLSEKKGMAQEINDLNIHIQKLATETRDKETQISSLKSEIQEYMTKLEEKNKDIVTFKCQNEEFERMVGEYQERLFDTQTELTAEFNKNKEFLDTNESLIKEIEELRGKSEYFEGKFSKFKRKYEEEAERNEIFRQENQGLATARESLEQDFNSLKQLLDEERRDSNEKSNFIEKMRSEWNFDREKIEKLNSNIEYLRECLQKEQEENSQKEQSISKFNKKISKLNSEITEKSHALKEADNEISTLSIKLQETLDSEKELKRIQEFDMKEIDNRVSSLLEELQIANAERCKFKQEASDFKKVNSSLETKANKSKEKYLKAKLDLDSFQKKIKSLEAQLQKLNYERELALKENDLARENIKKSTNTKIQVLEDIQSMIKSHKQGIHK